MTARVYLPLTASLLREARERRSFGPAPVRGHAVTPAVSEAVADEEEQEYAALAAASVAALALLADEDPPRRVVAAVDVDAWQPGDGADPTSVAVGHEVPWRWLAALLADSAGAEEAVRRVRDGAQNEEAVEACLDHELGWFAAQEADDLLGELGA